MILICLTLISVIVFVGIKNKKKRVLDVIIRVICIILILIINLRPMVYKGEEDVILNDLDVLLVIDTTISMSGQDIENGKKNRLEKVKVRKRGC